MEKALQKVASSANPDMGIINILINKGRVDSRNLNNSLRMSLLEKSLEQDSPEVFLTLAQQGEGNPGWDLSKNIAKSGDYLTLLNVAAKLGNVDIVRYLAGQVNVNDRSGRDTPLMSAISGGNLEVVKILVEEGRANVNLSSSMGFAPIHALGFKGGAEITEYLVGKNLDINLPLRVGGFGRDIEISPIMFAASNFHTDIVRIFLQNNANLVTSSTSQCPQTSIANLAVLTVKPAYLKTLAEAGMNLSEEQLIRGEMESPISVTLATESIPKKEKAEILRVLLEDAGVNPNERIKDERELTAFQEALSDPNVSLEIIKLMIDLGADLKGKRDEIARPIHQAWGARNNRSAKTVKLLIENGVSPDSTLRLPDGRELSLLANSVLSERQDMVEMLLEKGAKTEGLKEEVAFYWGKEKTESSEVLKKILTVGAGKKVPAFSAEAAGSGKKIEAVNLKKGLGQDKSGAFK